MNIPYFSKRGQVIMLIVNIFSLWLIDKAVISVFIMLVSEGYYIIIIIGAYHWKSSIFQVWSFQRKLGRTPELTIQDGCSVSLLFVKVVHYAVYQTLSLVFVSLNKLYQYCATSICRHDVSFFYCSLSLCVFIGWYLQTMAKTTKGFWSPIQAPKC